MRADQTRPDELLPRSDGLRVDSGWNLFGSLAGELNLFGPLQLSYRARLGLHDERVSSEIRQLLLRARWGDWTLTGGRGLRRLGRGSSGRLLVDDNAPAFDHVLLRNHRPLRLPGPLAFVGQFRLEIFNGVLPRADEFSEDSRYRSAGIPVDRPHLLGMRLDWAPTSWLEMGMSRTALYGGEGRESYDTFGEWWRLLSAVDENEVGSESDGLDSEQFASVDLSVEVDGLDGPGPLHRLRGYLEYAGTDLFAVWQGDDVAGPSPLRLANVGMVRGVVLAAKSVALRIEHVRTSPSWYRHRRYPQGYTHGGVPLGHPLGGDARAWFFRADGHWRSDWSGSVSLSLQERGHSLEQPERRRSWRLRLTHGPSALLAVSELFLDLRLDEIDFALDAPMRTDRNQVILGVGLRYHPR